MESPLSANWPAAWISIFTLILSPLKSFLLPRVPEQWRTVAAGVICFAFTAVAVRFTPLLPSEYMVQAMVLFGMVTSGYIASRTKTGTVAGLGLAAAGAGVSGGMAWIVPAVLAQDPSAAGVGEAAKEAAKGQLLWWMSCAFSVLSGRIARWLDGKTWTGTDSGQKK